MYENLEVGKRTMSQLAWWAHGVLRKDTSRWGIKVSDSTLNAGEAEERRRNMRGQRGNKGHYYATKD